MCQWSPLGKNTKTRNYYQYYAILQYEAKRPEARKHGDGRCHVIYRVSLTPILVDLVLSCLLSLGPPAGRDALFATDW